MTAQSSATAPRFDYAVLAINDLVVQSEEDKKTGRKQAKAVLVHDEPCQPSQRFWTSLYARYGLNNSVFKYYDHSEVFLRIAEKEANDRIRICIERTQTDSGQPNNRLVGVSNPERPLVIYEELTDLLQRHHGDSINYHDGIVESTHTPRVGANTFAIAGDTFVNRFILQTPIDGYGQPNLYLSLLRQICANGVIGYAKAFKSSLTLGKGADDVAPALVRTLDSFNHDEGYAALRQRLEAATQSWASVNETNTLYRLLTKLHARKDIEDQQALTELGGVRGAGSGNKASYFEQLLRSSHGENGRENGQPLGEDTLLKGSPLFRAYHLMSGDVQRLYGLASLDALSVKRQRTLPVKATVYDLINFATEVATHYANPAGARQLQAWVGNLVGSGEEFDLEQTVAQVGDFADFLIERKHLAGVENKHG